MRLRACVGAVAVLLGCSDSGIPKATVISPDGLRVIWPAYSPDGERIAYWTPAAGGNTQLWVASADMSAPVTLPVIGGGEPALWSPDGTRLLAVARDHGLAHAVVVPVAGGAAQRVATGSGVDVPAGWFPDGDRVVYGSLGAGSQISAFVVSLRTGVARPLVPSEARPLVGSPSPDGSRVAYVVIVGERGTMWVADSTGRNPRQLTTEGFESTNYNSVPWSPDGKAFLYESRRTGTADLWIARVDSGTIRQLTNDLRNDWSGVWSPDGKWIAFVSERGRQTDIWVVPAAGGDARRVTDTRDLEFDPTWRPGTTELGFTSLTAKSAVWAMDLASGTERRLTPDSLRVVWFRVSPDGQQISYVIDRGGGVQDLVVMPLAGGPSRTVVTGSELSNPQWSPDGSTIAYISGGFGSRDVWVVDVGGGPPRQLVNWPGNETAAEWSGDGSAVYFMSDHDNTNLFDLWKVPSGGGEPSRVTNVGNVNGQLSTRAGVADVLLGTIEPGEGHIAFSRVRPDGRMNSVWSRSNAFPFTFSPSGDSVLAAVEQPDGKMQMMILSAAGGGGRVILGPGEDAVSWSSDGKAILFRTAADEAGYHDVGILTIADGARRLLTKTPENEALPQFSPDGKTAVFARNSFVQRLHSVDMAKVLGGAR